MTDQESSADWLPAGWTVEVKVRKYGRNYKCYVDPSNRLKFYSKPEVFRYLNKIEINHSKSNVKKKSISKRSAAKFVVEKVAAEGLPPGWIKEMRIRKQGRKIRRDPHYIDPVSGYVFNSMKGVLRYLKTGELGRLASKPKDKGSSSMELEDVKVALPSVAEGQNLAESGINGKILRNQSFDEAVKDEQNLKSTSTGDCIPQTEHTSDQGREEAAVSSVNLPKAKDLEQRGGKSDSTIGVCASAHVVGPLPEKLPFGNGVERHRNGNVQQRSNKRKNKRDPNLPRRASKRLAGVELDPAPELKTNNRARRIAASKSSEAEAKTDEKSGNLTTPEDHSGKEEVENKADEKQGCTLVLPPRNLDIREEHVGQVETVYKAEEKPELPPNLSQSDSWMDPCIDFAIKTLTGAIPIEDANKADKNPGSMGDSWSDPCIEFAIKTLTGAIPIGGDENKAQQNPGYPLDLPFGELWTDPCIEFAVKTLTGAIPVGDNLSVQDYMQQQPCSSETQRTKGLTLQNGNLDFSDTDLWCQQSNTAEKPLFKQQEQVKHTFPHTGNISFQNSDNDALRQHVEERSEECPRRTML